VAPRRSIWQRQIKPHAYIGETILLIGVMAVLNLAFMPAQPGFMGIEPNPFWVPVLLMVVRYGFRASLLAGALAAATYMTLLTIRVRENVLGFRDLMTWTYAKSAVLFILVGTALGILVERHRARIRRLTQENELLARDNQLLKRGEEELRDVNEELANRVVGATDTLPMLYKYAKKLNDLDMNQIFTALTELVVEVIKATRCAVYEVDGRRLVRHSLNGQRSGERTELRLEPEVIEEIVGKRKLITLHDLLARNIRRKDVFLCGPLSAGLSGKVLAVLVVEELEFLRYNPATVRLFNVIVDWAAASLEKAARFAANPEQLRMEQAKTSVLRAQRATLAPGVKSATMAPVVSGGIERSRATADDRPVGGLPSIATAGAGAGAGGLSQLLDQASARLFGEVSAAQPASEDDEATAELAAPDPQSLLEMQQMLSGELKIASTHGSPLAKLLNEIDGYIAGRGGKQ